MKKLLAILTSISLTSNIFLISAVTACSCSNTVAPSSEFSLNNVTIKYSTIVKHMNKIDSQEANNIKSGVQTKIINQLKTFSLENNIDYSITRMDTLIANADLNEVSIIVSANSTSNKVKGTTKVLFSVKENINDRKITPAIEVPISEQNGLLYTSAERIKNIILGTVDNILTVSQESDYGTDYIIDHIDDIKEGAVYNDYKDLLYVTSTVSSKNLIGQFKVDFQLV